MERVYSLVVNVYTQISNNGGVVDSNVENIQRKLKSKIDT
jgi:hypothetical protein